jgi:MoCo/4Fe-4S cofactor protein with predicted Tat translocation signal
MKTNPPSSNRGPAYWRSLEHLSNTPEIQELIGKEFPGYDVDDMLNVNGSRRHFLKLAGASMALAGLTLTGCRRWPEEKLAPYSTNPRDRMPGVPEQYATAFEIGGVAQPLLVTSFDGRPIKIEGNPSHPFSWTVKDKLGSADAFAQASILEMYDPERGKRKSPVDRNAKPPKDVAWAQFAAFVKQHFTALKKDGKGFAILSESSASPSVADMKARVLKAFPQARWFEYEPVNRDAETEGAKLAFGRPVRTMLHLDKAGKVVLLDADPLGMHPAHVRYASDWAQRRRSVDAAQTAEMSRVYIAESGFSLSGSVADVRLPVSPARLYAIARAIAGKLGVAGIEEEKSLAPDEARFVERAAADLKAAGRDGLVAVGGVMPPAGHALVHAINEKLGCIGNTVTLLEDPAAGDLSHAQAISQVAAELKAGQFDTLLIVGGNPAYDAPVDLAFDKVIAAAPVSIHLSNYDNETSHQCKWHVPRAHYLESWGDARAWDGTAGIIQPLIMPLYDGKSTIELLAMVLGDSVTDGHEIVKRTWAGMLPKDGLDLALRKVIESGLLPGSGFKAAAVKVKAQEFPPATPATAPGSGGYYLRFQPDSHAYDGRFANNGWLQETPDPLTKLVWDNAALMSRKDADQINVSEGTLVRIQTDAKYGQNSVEVPVFILPGHPEGVITLPLGYGRTAAGHIGDDLGRNTYLVRTTEGALLNSGATLSRGSGDYLLVTSQEQHLINTIGWEGVQKRIGGVDESGIIIHETTLAEYKENPRAAHGGKPRRVGLMLFEEPARLNDTHAWGMAIDMNACIGCNACALACQSENNIPIVGKEQANMHRMMNWIRIDRYFKGEPDNDNIEVVYQPMTCQHCENAPCEQVCPVGATVHDTEGINTMVYNRCVGTRYCSNNCPYKVRRFNYLDYHSQDPRQYFAKPYLNIPDLQQTEFFSREDEKVKKLVFNPEVTVRMRGVMEKCTYCVQRVHRATIAKRAEGSDVVDGDIVTACQQACPTQAIVFGDLNDRGSKVSKLQHSQRAYGVLHEELDTRPRTQYLAKIRNPDDGKAEAKHEA